MFGEVYSGGIHGAGKHERMATIAQKTSGGDQHFTCWTMYDAVVQNQFYTVYCALLFALPGIDHGAPW